MTNKNFSTSFTVGNTPAEVFRAVNNVADWWTKNLEGKSHALNDEFIVRFGDVHYSKQQLVEVVPDQKVVWLVTDSKLSFVRDKSEWTGTRIIFEIAAKGKETELRFTHEGLTVALECYDACSNVWTQYVQSLQQLIATGKGNPDGHK